MPSAIADTVSNHTGGSCSRRSHDVDVKKMNEEGYTGLSHIIPPVPAFAEPSKELTREPSETITTTPLYPFDVTMAPAPKSIIWPCVDAPQCGLGSSLSIKSGVFQDYMKFKESLAPMMGVGAVAEGEAPLMAFDAFNCVIPVRGTPSDIFNSGFRLSANVILPAPAPLFFGIRWAGVDHILGYDEAACFASDYPCSGTFECVWNIGEEPTFAEFLGMLGETPEPGRYEYAWIAGYNLNEEPMIADVLDAILVIDSDSGLWPLVLAVGGIAAGSIMMV